MTTMNVNKSNKIHFEANVRECFSFLESVGKMKFEGVRISGGSDPRDSSLIVRYSRDDFRADIGWSWIENSLVILLRFDRNDLARHDRHVYLEPFIEFLTNGETKAIVPYIRKGMSIKQLETVMEERSKLFDKGCDAVVKIMGARMESFLQQIESAPSDAIRKYHEWYD